jgi:hypothetical protein
LHAAAHLLSLLYEGTNLGEIAKAFEHRMPFKGEQWAGAPARNVTLPVLSFSTLYYSTPLLFSSGGV